MSLPNNYRQEIFSCPLTFLNNNTTLVDNTPIFYLTYFNSADLSLSFNVIKTSTGLLEIFINMKKCSPLLKIVNTSMILKTDHKIRPILNQSFSFDRDNNTYIKIDTNRIINLENETLPGCYKYVPWNPYSEEYNFRRSLYTFEIVCNIHNFEKSTLQCFQLPLYYPIFENHGPTFNIKTKDGDFIGINPQLWERHSSFIKTVISNNPISNNNNQYINISDTSTSVILIVKQYIEDNISIKHTDNLLELLYFGHKYHFIAFVEICMIEFYNRLLSQNVTKEDITECNKNLESFTKKESNNISVNVMTKAWKKEALIDITDYISGFVKE